MKKGRTRCPTSSFIIHTFLNVPRRGLGEAVHLRFRVFLAVLHHVGESHQRFVGAAVFTQKCEFLSSGRSPGESRHSPRPLAPLEALHHVAGDAVFLVHHGDGLFRVVGRVADDAVQGRTICVTDRMM